jgi:hypothetical protein
MDTLSVLDKLSNKDIAKLSTTKLLYVTFSYYTTMPKMIETLDMLIIELSKKCSLHMLDIRANLSVYSDCVLVTYRKLLRTVLSKQTLRRIIIDTAFTYKQTLSEIHDWGNVDKITFVGRHVKPGGSWDPVRCNLDIHNVAKSNICYITLFNHDLVLLPITRPVGNYEMADLIASGVKKLPKIYLPEYADALRVNRRAKKTFAVIQLLLLMTMHRKGVDKNLAFMIISFMKMNDWKNLKK